MFAVNEKTTVSKALLVLALQLVVVYGEIDSTGSLKVDDKHVQDIALFNAIYNDIEDCVGEESVETDDCLEMFRSSDLEDPRYDRCKCLVPCMGKKMEILLPDGTYNFTAVRNISRVLQSDYIRDELLRILDICETEPGTYCEGGFNIVNCAIQHSHIVARSVRMLLESLDEHFSQSPMDANPNEDSNSDSANNIEADTP